MRFEVIGWYYRLKQIPVTTGCCKLLYLPWVLGLWQLVTKYCTYFYYCHYSQFKMYTMTLFHHYLISMDFSFFKYQFLRISVSTDFCFFEFQILPISVPPKFSFSRFQFLLILVSPHFRLYRFPLLQIAFFLLWISVSLDFFFTGLNFVLQFIICYYSLLNLTFNNRVFQITLDYSMLLKVNKCLTCCNFYHIDTFTIKQNISHRLILKPLITIY